MNAPLHSTMLDLGDVARARAPQLHDAPALHPGERAVAIATWQGRMGNEHASAKVFEALAEQARAAGLTAATVATLEQFRGEELRHGELCAAAAVALGGEAVVDLGARAQVPWHRDVDPLEGLLRNVLSISCLSETVAVALIASERLETGPAALQETLRSILADEVGHARFGWALLDQLTPRIGPARAARLDAWLRLAFGHVEAHELRELAAGPSPSRAATDVGVCDGDQARRLFYDTVRDVIVPGLERRGLRAGWAWAHRVVPGG
ncbi:MAG: ferritin-like domain-containing protein [Deltaproteobacteria bacterium]|nr:ferritin-like domain-containing protein [Deltaproteobacteria bacterium]